MDYKLQLNCTRRATRRNNSLDVNVPNRFEPSSRRATFVSTTRIRFLSVLGVSLAVG